MELEEEEHCPGGMGAGQMEIPDSPAVPTLQVRTQGTKIRIDVTESLALVFMC